MSGNARLEALPSVKGAATVNVLPIIGGNTSRIIVEGKPRISYSVSQQTHEVGIRLALGASPRDILKLVIGRGLVLTVGGFGTGMLVALAVTRFLSTLLFRVSPTDPSAFASLTLLLGCVALLACFVPARRATRVDPLVALRYE